jgi:hypothetical protein
MSAVPVASSSPATPLFAEVMAGEGKSLLQMAHRCPPGRGVGPHLNTSTLWRWCRQGVLLPDGRRVRLEALRVAGRWVTSEKALARFVAAQQAVSGPAEASVPPTPAQRQRAAERAGAELEARGA